MNKVAGTGAGIVVVAAIIVGVIALANHNTAQPSPMSDMQMNGQAAPKSPPAVNQPVSSTIAIQNFAFSPASIRVKTGTTLTWTNHDSVTHTVTETDGQKGPNSGELASGKSYSFTFDTPGTYHYHCAIHPDMLGTVVVTNAQ